MYQTHVLISIPSGKFDASCMSWRFVNAGLFCVAIFHGLNFWSHNENSSPDSSHSGGFSNTFEFASTTAIMI